MKTIKNKVENILKNFPQTRASDDKLIARYIFEYHKNMVDLLGDDAVIKLKDLAKLPSFETIRRSRQLIQNTEKKYQPEPKVIEYRREQEQSMRDTINMMTEYQRL